MTSTGFNMQSFSSSLSLSLCWPWRVVVIISVVCAAALFACYAEQIFHSIVGFLCPKRAKNVKFSGLKSLLMFTAESGDHVSVVGVSGSCPWAVPQGGVGVNGCFRKWDVSGVWGEKLHFGIYLFVGKCVADYISNRCVLRLLFRSPWWGHGCKDSKVCSLVLHFGSDWKISTTIGWIAMTFGTNIHAPERMNPNEFCDQLFSCQILDWQISMVPR